MNARPAPRTRPWACPFLAGLLVCGMALPMGGGHGRIDRPVCDPRAGYPRVRHLDFSLGDPGSGLRDLVGATDLRGLDLFGTRIDDDGLEHLGGLTDLKALYLESTPVGDEGLSHLRRLTKLRTLTLSDTKVTDAGLVHLKCLTGLRALDLSYTAVTEAGIAELRHALPGTEITTERGADANGAISTRDGKGVGFAAGSDPSRLTTSSPSTDSSASSSGSSKAADESEF